MHKVPVNRQPQVAAELGRYATTMRIILLIISAVYFWPHVVSACSCMPGSSDSEAARKRGLENAFCAADLVFSGRVDRIREFRGSEQGWPEEEYQIWAISTYKGEIISPSYILSRLHVGTCDKKFENDAKYLVFGKRRDDGFYIHVTFCGLTSKLDAATWAAQALDDDSSGARTIDCSAEGRRKRWVEGWVDVNDQPDLTIDDE